MHTAYTLAFGGGLMAGARAGDLFGRRRMLMLGLGSAILAPATLALLSVSFPEGPERTRALGWYGATAGVGASIGMVLGGVLADLLSWRAGFFINVPIGIALLWAAWRCVPVDRQRPGTLDLPGALLSTAGMVLLVYGLVGSAETGWHSAGSPGPLALGAVLLAGFFRHEARTARPLLPLRLFDDRVRSGAYAARLLFLAGVIGCWFYLTQYLQGVLGMRPLQAGLAFLPATVVQLGAASGLVNAAHQLGGSLGLALLVVVYAASAGQAGGAAADLAHRVAMCLGVSAGLLGVA